MNDKLQLRDLLASSRSQVYLLWAFLTGIGFVATHYYQRNNINVLWIVISLIGLGFMYKVMPLGVSQMKKIFAAWLVPIVIGIIVSVLAVQTSLFPDLIAYLGAYWLVVMAAGYIWNGLVDRPALWYFVAAGMNIAAAVVLYSVDSLLQIQYLIVAVVSVWSMLNLWIFRSDV